MENRRKRKLIRVDLQLKIVFLTLLVACLALLINFQLSLAALWSLEATLSNTSSVELLVEEVREVLLQKFLLSVGIGIPFAVSVGLLYSFKFCGPICRFKVYFSELCGGSWRKPCTLRKGDDLQDVAQAINHVVDQACDYAEDTHELLQEVRAVVGELEDTVEDEALGQRLTKIKEGIAREAAFYSKHFAQPVTDVALENASEPAKEATSV